MRRGNAGLYGVQGAADFRQHAAVHRAVGDQLIDTSRGQAREHLALGIHEARDIGQEHQLLRLHDLRQGAGDQIGVDVVGVALLVHTDRCDHRDEIAAQDDVENFAVDLTHLADLADVDDFRGVGPGAWRVALMRRARIRRPSLPVMPMARPPARLIEATISLLTLPPSTISTTSMVCESVTRMPSTNSLRCPELLQQAADLRPPAVDHDRVHSHEFHQHDVAGEALVQLGSTMALPPNLTTIVRPVKRWM
jgi:hypothetical protein